MRTAGRGAPYHVALVALAAVVLLVPLGGGPPSQGPSAGPSAKHASHAGTPLLGALGPDSRSRPGAPIGAPLPQVAPRNLLVVAPCESGWNAEVEQAYDATLGYLFETWIGCGGIGFARSTDGGYSFGAAQAVPGSVPAAGSSWDPSLAVAPNGTVYVAYMVNNGTGGTPAVAWSWDHGATFAGWALVTPPNATSFRDRDFLAVAPNGTVDVTWDDSPVSWMDALGCAAGGSCYFLAGDYNVVIASSADGGRNWSAPVPIDPLYPNGGSVAAPIVVEPNGTIDVLFESFNVSGTSHTLGAGYNYFTRSTDGGTSWSTPVRVANLSFRNTTWWIDGDLARDAGGLLYATFDSQSGSADTAWVVVSSDGGATWGAPVRVNPDAGTAVHALVSVAGATNGTAYVAWMANNSSGGWNAYVSPLTVRSNGSAWGPITTVSAQAGLPGYWIGDTLGVSYLGGNASAVSWTYGVTLNGTNNSEVYAAVIGVPPPGAPTIVSAVPGAAQVTLTWSAPAAGPTPTAYRVAWSVEGAPAGEVEVLASTTTTVVGGLLAGARYLFNVTALDAGGDGPASAAVHLELTAWEVVAGTTAPAGAQVALDSVALPVVAGRFAINTTFTAHLLTAVAHDYQPIQEALATAWNGTVWANVTLALLGGSVRGTVFPALSDVTWDALPVLVSSGTYAIGAGGNTTHVLAASYPGFATWSRTVTVPPNATLFANVTLRPLDGHLGFVVRPVNATLQVNASPVVLDAGGGANLSLPPGTYPIVAAAPGFETYFANLTILPGQWRNLSFALVPQPAGPSGPPPGPGTGSLADLLGNPVAIAAILAGIVVVVLGVRWAVRRRPPPSEPVEYDASEMASEGPALPEDLPPELPEGPT